MENLKHKNSIRFAFILLTSAVGLYSCKKDSSTDAAVDSQISFSVKADQTASTISNASTGVTAASVPSITWTEGVANVTKFEFEAKKGNVKKEIEVSGLTNINLFAIDPTVVKSVIDTGTYKEIELKLVLTKSLTAAIPLVLKGSFTAADGTVIPVEVDVNEDLTVKAEVNNVTIDSSTDLKTTIMLHLNKIFAGISLSDLSAAVKTSGSIIISSSSNTTIFNKAKANLQSIGGAEVEHQNKSGKNNDGPGHT